MKITLSTICGLVLFGIAGCGPSEQDRREAEIQERQDAYIEEVSTLPGDEPKDLRKTQSAKSEDLKTLDRDDFIEDMVAEGMARDEAEAMWEEMNVSPSDEDNEEDPFDFSNVTGPADTT